MTELTDFVMIAEAEAETGIQAATIRRWIRVGLVEGKKLGPHKKSPWLVKLSDVQGRELGPNRWHSEKEEQS